MIVMSIRTVYTAAGTMTATNSTFKWQQADVQQHSAAFTPSTPAKRYYFTCV